MLSRCEKFLNQFKRLKSDQICLFEQSEALNYIGLSLSPACLRSLRIMCFQQLIALTTVLSDVMAILHSILIDISIVFIKHLSGNVHSTHILNGLSTLPLSLLLPIIVYVYHKYLIRKIRLQQTGSYSFSELSMRPQQSFDCQSILTLINKLCTPLHNPLTRSLPLACRICVTHIEMCPNK